MFDGVLDRLGLSKTNSGVFSGNWHKIKDATLSSINPATGETIARVSVADQSDYEATVERVVAAQLEWRRLPAPARGEVVRQIGLELRKHKKDLGLLVTLECGKILSEGEGEVQEMIDMCDFAVGLSRQLYGLTMPSERPDHRMFEQWQPLGAVGVITAFNFPVAVWAWNAAVAFVCGDSTAWKPSPETPLTAIAVQNIVQAVLERNGYPAISTLCIGADAEVGKMMAADRRFPLISATGSCEMGRSVASTVGGRLGRSLLELGGNNAIIMTETADLELSLRGVLFAAVGTAGQRCTTLRRLIIHESIVDKFIPRLAEAYGSVAIGEPWEDGVLMGPLISSSSVDHMMAAIDSATATGGKVLCGGKRLERAGNFVEPTVVLANTEMPIVSEETFAPILYVLPYKNLDDAIAIQNSVDQGLSSAIFTDRMRDAEKFLSAEGSDCGIANVNIGTSGAEIGGAFGGEKDTGGGREAGSDSWKAYMRRQTCTINYGDDLPLAQGVEFDV